MKFLGVLEGGFVTLAFGGQDVNNDRVIASLGELQRADQQRQVMAIDRAEITQPHFFEDQAVTVTAAAIGVHGALAWLEAYFSERAFEAFFGFMREGERQLAFGQTADKSFKILREFIVRGMRDELV